jgi:hypothetical protein
MEEQLYYATTDDDPQPDEFGGTEESISLTAKGSDPTHHIKLVDGEDASVGFTISDQEGDLDERTFRRFPITSPDNPYITEKQSSFGGGFGQATFEDNRAKYWRSMGVDTTKDSLVLGPMFHYGEGLHSQAEHFLPDGTCSWKSLTGALLWMAMPFTPSQAWTGTEYFKVFLRKQGNAPTLRIRFYTNSADAPNTLIHTEDIDPDTITDPNGQWVRFAVTDTYAYGSGTKYWAVLTTTGVISSDMGKWHILTQSNTVGKKSTNGSAWSSGPDFFFRVEGPRKTATHHFFEYKEQTYFLKSYDTAQASTLWMNGWRGAADLNALAGGDSVKLKDATQDWTNLLTGDEEVKFVAGSPSEEDEEIKGVVSGTSGELTVDRDWQQAHETRADYIVRGTDKWYEISAPGSQLAGKIRSVAVGNGIVMINRSGHRDQTWFREYNKAGTWTREWKQSGIRANHTRVINDPISGDIVWHGVNRDEDGEYYPEVWKQAGLIWDELGLHPVTLVRHQADGAGEYWQPSDAVVTITEIKKKQVEIKVTLASITGVSVDTAGDGGYQVNDILTIVDSGSSGTGQVRVTAVGSGGVTNVSIETIGYDYTTGVKDTTGGSGNGNCKISVDAVSTLTGQIAYTDLYELDDTTARTEDIRNCNWLKMTYLFDMVGGFPNQVAAGDIKLELDNNTGAGSPFTTVSFPALVTGVDMTKVHGTIELDLEGTDGAQSCASVGIKLDAAHGITKSFYIRLYKEIIVGRDIEPINVGQVDGDRITGLQSYGDPETLWVFTEAGLGQIKNNLYLPVPLREIKVARHANNGYGSEVSDVYLMFTWKGRLQRYYRQNIEDLGPDFPTGMGDIQGKIVDIKTYPGRMYVAVDGGWSNRSLILVHKGGAWHEVFTSFSGERIRKLWVQPINSVEDRLWASVGGDVMWFPIILDARELPDNANYLYMPVGYLDSSWIYTGDHDLNKVFRALVLTMDTAKDDDLDVVVYYKVNNEDNDWRKISDWKTKSYSTIEYKLTDSKDRLPRGNRIKFRYSLRSKDLTKSPVVRSTLARIYRIPEVKFAYTWLSKVSSISINLRGDEEKPVGTQSTPARAFKLLDKWARRLSLLTIESDIAAVNGQQVVLQPIPFQLLMIVHDEKIQEESIQMTANEV